MKKQIIILALIIFVGLTLTSCYSHDWEKLHPAPAITAPCILPATVSYSIDIVPILNASCSLNNSNCHSSASGYDFTNYTGVASECNPDTTSSSCGVYRDITGVSGNLMPQGGPKLNQCDIAKITRWIVQGYPKN